MRLIVMALTGLIALDLPAAADRLSDMAPAEEYRTSVSGVRHILKPHQTLSEMILFVGAGPQRCVPVSPESLICVWALSRRQSGWRPLSSALGTGDQLNLICEFPVREGPRTEESCSVHAQRSSREYYRRLAAKKRGHRNGPIKRYRSELQQAKAQERIDNARTAFELSTLVGDAPNQCNWLPPRTFCIWKTDAGTYGHGTLALSIGTSFHKKVRLGCSLPLSNAPREPQTCNAQVGY